VTAEEWMAAGSLLTESLGAPKLPGILADSVVARVNHAETDGMRNF